MSYYFETRKNWLEKELAQLTNKTAALPDGTLVFYYNGTKAYHQIKNKDGKYTRKYIPSSKKDLALKLARKTLIVDSISDINNELSAINAYLKARKKRKLQGLLAEGSPYLKLLSPENNWMEDDDYPKNPNYPEALVFKAPKGQFVRSKSEAIIAHALYDSHLSYRYELEMFLDDSTYYPDFSIHHPQTGKLYIWEHFGLADNPKYQNKMLNKTRTYINNGFIPGDNLILTYETKDQPLDINYVQNLISFHFGF